MQTGSTQPFAETTNQIDLNNVGWIIILILMLIIVALIIAWIIVDFIKEKKITTLQRNAKTNLSEQELNMLEKYRKLDPADKTNVDNLIFSLNKPPKI